MRFYEGKNRRTKRLASTDDYPTKRSVEPLAHAELQAVNASTDAGISLDNFIKLSYLPHVKEHLRASTSKGYEDIWRVHMNGREESQTRIRDYRTMDVQLLLNAIAEDNDHTITTLQHIKHFLSGVFRYAAVAGVREGNPVRECLLPKKARQAGETQAYTLDEIRKTLPVLSLLEKAAVACAAFAGLRLAELLGFEWPDYDGDDIRIKQSVWRGHKNPPKSRASKDYVPVIVPLRSILEAYRQVLGNPADGPVFPVDLEHIGNLKIRPKMEAIGIPWHGWHAFRRATASNLFELGADDMTVKRVLRHSKVQVTREHYIKVRDAKLDAAMQSLSDAFGPQMGHKKSEPPVSN